MRTLINGLTSAIIPEDEEQSQRVVSQQTSSKSDRLEGLPSPSTHCILLPVQCIDMQHIWQVLFRSSAVLWDPNPARRDLAPPDLESRVVSRLGLLHESIKVRNSGCAW